MKDDYKPNKDQSRANDNLTAACKSKNPAKISAAAAKAAASGFRAAASALSRRDYAQALYWSESSGILVRAAAEWGAIADLDARKAANIMRKLARGERKEDERDVLQIADLIESGKVEEAYDRCRALDTFVRDLFPAEVTLWMWWNGPRTLKTSGLMGEYPTGADFVLKS